MANFSSYGACWWVLFLFYNLYFGFFSEQDNETADSMFPEAEMQFVEALNALEIAMVGTTQHTHYRHNHLFLNIIAPTVLKPKTVEVLMTISCSLSLVGRCASIVSFVFTSIIVYIHF